MNTPVGDRHLVCSSLWLGGIFSAWGHPFIHNFIFRYIIEHSHWDPILLFHSENKKAFDWFLWLKTSAVSKRKSGFNNAGGKLLHSTPPMIHKSACKCQNQFKPFAERGSFERGLQRDITEVISQGVSHSDDFYSRLTKMIHSEN